MSWADSLGNARVLDQWRAAAGLEYEIEKPARRTHTLSGRKLKAGSSDRAAIASGPAEEAVGRGAGL